MGRIKTTISEQWIEVPVDAEQAAAIYAEYQNTLERLRELSAESPDDEILRADVGRALGRFAEAARLHGDVEEALEARDESARIWGELGRARASVLARIQAADIAHLARAPDAWRRFDELESTVSTPPYELYADFYWEYRALAHCRDKAFEDALESLREAFKLREEQGRKERQLTETLALIDRIERETSDDIFG